MNGLIQNPYCDLVDAISAPRAAEVLSGCSSVSAFAGTDALADPASAAIREYTFFTSHTYMFEVVGLQLLGEMTARLRSHDAIRALGSQAIDEARHVEVYGRIMGILEHAERPRDVPEQLHARLVLAGTLEEKLVRAFVVLESLAIGLLSARAKLFGDTSISRIERRVLLEESQHQTHGIELLADFVRDGRMTYGHILEITRQTMDEVGELLSPLPLLVDLGLRADRREVEAVQSVGVIALQRSVTLRCIGHSLRRLQKELRTC
jgi:hypothetical protein